MGFNILKPKKKPERKRKSKREFAIELFFRLIILTIAAIIVAFALECILLPNKVIDGGVIGISMMVNYVTHFNLGLTIFILNLPFVCLAWTNLGKMFVFQTFYAVAALGVATTYFENMHYVVIREPLLVVVFGGIILGVGVGLILRNSASLDCTEMLSIKLAKKFSSFSIGEFLMGFNLIIYTAAIFVFGVEQAMYSIITYFITSRMIDAIIDGFNSSKSIRIISEHHKEIGAAIMKELDVSVTYFKTLGGYSRESKILTYCVVSRLEVSKVKEIAKSIDPKAFLVIEAVHEVEGVRVKKGKK